MVTPTCRNDESLRSTLALDREAVERIQRTLFAVTEDIDTSVDRAFEGIRRTLPVDMESQALLRALRDEVVRDVYEQVEG